VRSIDQSRGFAKFGKPSYHINAENASTIWIPTKSSKKNLYSGVLLEPNSGISLRVIQNRNEGRTKEKNCDYKLEGD
jgi:hypothetical protein